MGTTQSTAKEFVDIEKAEAFPIWDNFPLKGVYVDLYLKGPRYSPSSFERGPVYPPPSTPIPIPGTRRWFD
jgi:hypothetical protein